MRLAHTITLTVFAKQGEDEKSILEKLVSLVPFSLEKEKLFVKRSCTEGFECKIIILELTLEKERHTNAFISSLKEKLGEEQRVLLATQENRVDEDCMFYMRLDKLSLLEGKYVLTDSGDCYHIKMSIAAFPKKRTVALEVVRKMLTQ